MIVCHGRMRRKLLLATALSSVSGLCGGGAFAQAIHSSTVDTQAAAPSAGTQVGEVIVTGQRAQKTLDQKRDAVGVVDGVSADEISKLPSTSIAEALVHVTGVSLTANNDNERGRNIAEHPAIRGLDSRYNNITVDGLPVATADFTGTGVSSRATPLDILPATLVQNIQVFKTYSPDQDPEAIGGGIALTTRSAFDNGGAPFAQFMLGGGFNSLNGTPVSQNPVNQNADLIFTHTFGDLKQFGFVLSLDYQRQADYTYDNATTDNTYYLYYSAAGTASSPNPAFGNGIPVPQQSKAWIIEEVTKKVDVTTKFEYRPSNQLNAFVSLGYYDDTNNSTRNEMILTPGGVLSNQTATSGTFSKGDVEVGGQYSPLHRTTFNYQVGATYRPTDSDVFDLRAGASHSSWFQPEYMVKFVTPAVSSPTGNTSPGSSTANAFNYVVYGNYSNFNMDPTYFANPLNYGGDYWRYRDRSIETDVHDLKLDYSHNAQASDMGFGFKMGAESKETRNRLTFRSPDYEPNTSNSITLAQAQQPSSFNIPNYSNLPFLFIDVNKAFTVLQNNPGLFHQSNQNAVVTNNFKLREIVADGYGMLVYNDAKFHASAGLRYDHANLDVTGNQQQPNPPGVATPGALPTNLPVFTPVRVTSDYGNVLPAASASYAPIKAFQFHAAISKTVGRPDYGDYNPSSGFSLDPNTNTVTITRGNPGLKPRLSTNYDLAGEWFFAPGSMLSVAGFYKDISNEIFSVANTGTAVFNGATFPSITTQAVNAASSNLKGVEFEWVHDNYGRISPWLEGFGTNFNYTVIGGHAVVPFTLVSGTTVTPGTRGLKELLNQPSTIGNAIVTYQRFGVFGALSYNYTGKSLRSLVGNSPWQDVYWSPHQQVDLKVGYHLRRDLDVTASVQNLSDEKTKSVTGLSQSLMKDISYVGQSVWFGVTYRPGF